MTGSRLQDFCYPGDGGPAGVVERGLSQDVMAVIDELAEAVRVSLDASPGQRRDCRYACAAWERALRAHGIDVQLRGGEGVDDEVSWATAWSRLIGGAAIERLTTGSIATTGSRSAPTA